MITSLRQQVCLADKKGLLQDLTIGMLISIAFSYLFYRSFWALIPMFIPGGVVFFQLQSERRKRRKREYLLQFKECIQSVSVSLKAGYAAENAFMESEKDMLGMFGEKSQIVADLRRIRAGLANRRTLDEMLFLMGEQSKEEEVQEFADVFHIAKRQGGDLSGMIQSACDMISKEIDLEEEIMVFLASQKMQQNIMDVMPMMIVLYMDFTNPGYFTSLYHNPQGVLIMTVCVVIYVAAYILSEKILGNGVA